MLFLGVEYKSTGKSILGEHTCGLFSSIYCRISILLDHVNETFYFCYLKKL